MLQEYRNHHIMQDKITDTFAVMNNRILLLAADFMDAAAAKKWIDKRIERFPWAGDKQANSGVSAS